MKVARQSIFALCLFYSVDTLMLAQGVQAQGVPDEARGELLYSIHCNTCHSSTIHWRGKKLATNWKSLQYQVNRWQAYANLDWTEDDIGDVAFYLNAHYYNFYNIEPKALTQHDGE
jgi:mono/diheme cytochrome c family protein